MLRKKNFTLTQKTLCLMVIWVLRFSPLVLFGFISLTILNKPCAVFEKASAQSLCYVRETGIQRLKSLEVLFSFESSSMNNENL